MKVMACLLLFFSFFSTKRAFANTSDSTRVDSVLYLNNEVLVSALRYEEKVFDLPQAVSAINNIQIKQLAPMSMPDVLTELPGIWMQKTNLGGGSPFIRGFTGYQVLMLIDGVRFNNSTFRSGPNQYLNTIDPFLVGKVEVLRGQGAVQYGSDAIGGTINMLTPQLDFSSTGTVINGSVYGKYLSKNMEKTGRISLTLSSLGTAFQVGTTFKKLGDLVAGGNLGTLHPTGYNEYSFDMKLRQRINQNQEIIGAYQHHKQRHVPLYHKVITGEYSTYEFDPQQRDFGYLRWKANLNTKVFKSISYTISYQKFLEVRKKQKTGNSIMRTELDEVQTVGNVIELVSMPTANWVVSSGLEFYHDGIRSSAIEIDERNQELVEMRGLYPDNSKSNNLAAFLLNSVRLIKWNFSFGVRYNYVDLKLKDSTFGEVQVSPDALVANGGVVYKITPHNNVSLAVSSGFRAPNINDVSSLGEADFRYEVPNYDLLPENSLSVDLAWKARFERFSSNFHLYQTTLTNLITNVRSQYMGQDSINQLQVYTRQNSGEALIYGTEADLNYLIIPSLQLYGGITYTYGQNISRDEPMRRIPPLFGSLGAMYSFYGNVRLKMEWKHANTQTRLSAGDNDDNRIPEGGSKPWDVLNFSAHYEHDRVTVRAGINNIFNEAYRMHGSGIDGVGRSLWLAIRINF